MKEAPRSSTKTIIEATRIIAKWHQDAAFNARTDGGATDHMIHAAALTEAADEIERLRALVDEQRKKIDKAERVLLAGGQMNEGKGP